MPPAKTLRLGALNVVMQPHRGGPADYIAALNRAKLNRERIQANFYADRWAFIGSVRQVSATRLYGRLDTFTKVDMEGDWLNTEALFRESVDAGEVAATASGEDLESIVIPSNLKPSYKPAYFVFDAVRHRLIFDLRGIRHTQARAAFETLLQLAVGDDVEVRVSIMTSTEAVERIKSMSTLKSLHFRFYRPNPAGEGLGRTLEERLISSDSDELDLAFRSSRTIQIDEALEELLRHAAEDGAEVKARGVERAGERTKTVSNSEHPLVDVTKYPPQANDLEAIRGRADELLE